IPNEVPEPIQRDQCCCRIGAATTQAGARRDVLVQLDGDAEVGSGCGLKRPRGDDDEIVVGGDLSASAFADPRATVARGEHELVREIDELEHGLQVVVTVLTAAQHVQKQVQLRWRRRLERLHCALHWSTTSRILAPSRSATTMPGTTTPSCSV